MPDSHTEDSPALVDFSDTEALVADPHLIRMLAGDLAAVRYSVAGVEELLGESVYAALNREQFVPALRRSGAAMRSGDPLAVLVQLFPLARAVPGALLETALPTIGLAGMLRLGLIAPAALPEFPAALPEFTLPESPRAESAPSESEQPECYRALVDLSPYSFTDESGAVDLWVASDLAAHQRPGVLRHDHVLGIGQASLTLAQLIVRKPVDIAADLGVGCGIQTFHLLRHARKVIATDISARALNFARFNLMLNAEALELDPEHLTERVELRSGHLLEPLLGERFDLLVSNPPFVITPRKKAQEPGADPEAVFIYRDGGLPGDQIVSELLHGLPELLRPGGLAQLLGNWEIADPEAEPGQAGSWQERLDVWIAPELDAWVIQREELSPERYAEAWLQDAAQSRDPDAYDRAYTAYLEDFAARGVNAVGFGSVWVRQPAQPGSIPPFRRFEAIGHPLEQPIGPQLGLAIARADWLAGHCAPESLDAGHLVVPEDVTEERHQRPGAEHPAIILLRQGAGFRRTRILSSELAGLVSACDGTLSVGQILTALSVLLEEQIDTELLRGQVRELIRNGFLTPQDLVSG
ncbi:methyltransferase [Acaricomes phytoseiuli]|uniref:DUF7059 domain-containing protein n=1 Tax=Acaricomes phytoseiuli TaxID=291968 RepID=UPI000382B8ED|nr:methyltransferase [Acaricomes phytoseiuli]MCW1249692.1 methyltransferase [Acaricomes phytoseiuli]